MPGESSVNKPNGKAGSDTRAEAQHRVGGFEILSRIGKGGMGAVFRARQISMDRHVALKILPPQLARDQQFVTRFLREAQSAARLNHPNIVQAFDAGKADGYHYFAMELVDGMSLRGLLNEQPHLSERRALEITREIAKALEYAHQCGIIHRDVKPENILITSTGIAKLADLGLARETSESESSLTQSGTAVGTPNYISPEQVRGEKDLDGRCDIYSLGATLYHALVGSAPFAGGTGNEVMAKHLTSPIPNPRRSRPEISYETSRIVLKAMAKDRDRRYASATEMLADIERVLATPDAELTRTAEVIEEAEPEARAPRGRQWVLAGAAIALFAAATFIGIMKMQQPASKSAEEEVAGDQMPAPNGLTARPVVPAPSVEPRSIPTQAGTRRPIEIDLNEQLQTLVDQNEFIKAQQLVSRHAENNSTQVVDQINTWIHSRAQQRCRTLYDQVKAAVKKNDFRTARDLVNQVKGFGYSDLTEEADKRLDELSKREQQAALWTEWESTQEKAARLAKESRFDEAVALLAAMKKSAVPEIAEKAQGEIEAVKQRRTQQMESLVDDYRRSSESAWALLKQRDYAGADRAFAQIRHDLSDKLPDPMYQLVAEELEADQKVPALLRSFWSDVEKGVKARGGMIAFPGARGDVVSVEQGQITIRMGDTLVKRPVTEMTARQALGYLPRSSGSLVQGLFMMAEQVDLDKASAALEKAGDAPEIAVYKDRVEGLRLGAAEQAARQLWTQIQRINEHKELAQSDQENLLALVRRFDRDCSKTQIAQDVREELAGVRLRLLPTFSDWPFAPAEAKQRQQRTAEILDCPVEKTVDLGDGVKLDLILVPAGEFTMGGPASFGQDTGDSQHRVRITQPFYISKHEITVEQWKKLLPGRNSDLPASSKPVDFANWYDCQSFIAALNKTEGGFRLPTEAEWEFACRAGTDTEFCFGDRITEEQANFRFRMPRPPQGRPQEPPGPPQNAPLPAAKPVGSYPQNAFGIFDMHGNVAEWCYDFLAPYPQADAAVTDPQGPASGSQRSVRGGSFTFGPTPSFRRFGFSPMLRIFGTGFRVVESCPGLPLRTFSIPKAPAEGFPDMKIERLDDGKTVPNLRWLPGWYIEGETAEGTWWLQLPFQLQDVRREGPGWVLIDLNHARQGIVEPSGVFRPFRQDLPPE